VLVKQGYNLFYYRNDKATLEMDFFVRDANSLIPIEVKSNDNATASLNNLLKTGKYPDVKYGIKLGYKNIGFNGKFYTFPYFLTFLLKRFLNSNHVIMVLGNHKTCHLRVLSQIKTYISRRRIYNTANSRLGMASK
jgi:predicted AAA+ superfamily ATPase